MREKPALLFRVRRDTLVPSSAFDAEELQRFPQDKDVEITIKQRRSLPQMRTYWMALSRIVDATEIAPTKEHLHDLIKIELGYVTLIKLLDGSVAQWPDSTAFANMGQPEWQRFFDAAMKLLAETTGIDPLAFLEEREAA